MGWSVLRVAMVVGLLTSACDRSDNRKGDSQSSPPATLAQLHAALVDRVDFDFDLSLFVLEDGELTTIGPATRVYSFDSITKTITGLLLARLVESTELELTTPIGSLLRAGDNGDITLGQLATHSAGLPRLAPNADEWPGFDRDNPYAGYTAAMAELALRGVELRERSEYSNYGFQLLGLALERATGQSLGELGKRLVFAPAGMRRADIPQRGGILAQGLREGRPAPAWDEQLGGAGGAIGTIRDLASYGRAMLTPPAELHGAIPIVFGESDLSNAGALAWVTTDGLTWHNGGSYAYSSLIVLDRRNGRAAGYLAATGDLDSDAERLVFDFLESRP